MKIAIKHSPFKKDMVCLEEIRYGLNELEIKKAIIEYIEGYENLSSSTEWSFEWRVEDGKLVIELVRELVKKETAVIA